MIVLYDIGQKPTKFQIKEGQLAYNIKDNKTYSKDKWDNIIEVFETGTEIGGNTNKRKNHLINGDMSIWQRGTTFSTDGEYTADRWLLRQGGETSSVAINSSGNTNANWEGHAAMSFEATAGSSANLSRRVMQRIENVNTFKNKDVTLSFIHNASTGQNIYAKLFQIDDTGTAIWDSGLYNIATGTSTVKRDSQTFTLPDITTKETPEDSYLAVVIYPQYTNGSSVSISAIQLEDGDSATEFEIITPATQLARCQRYYEESSDTHNPTMHQEDDITTVRSTTINFKVTKRGIPSISNLTTNIGTAGATRIGLDGFRSRVAGTAAGDVVFTLTYEADAEL